MGEQLTALDATFLELEELDQSAHMHIGGVMVLEPQPDGVPPLDQIRRDVITRLPDLPRYTQRLSQPRTGGLHWPTWEKDKDFQVERHVFSAGLHAPGGRDELMEWAGEYFSQRLDRTKPLWEIAIVELSDGHWALVTKT
ncbi:MAG TPA: wax ester/triacylglycerol synthase domain-containing protein, partial [Solirubrobacterales bacterium]|nr:wax ester/triacylglycerol synthase domain-containing protein [Solirubrobacterales bacterium]